MAFNIWCGLPRSGKSCIMVNKVLGSWLTNSTRQIYHNLPFEKNGVSRLNNFLAFLARSSAVREGYRARLHFLEPVEREAKDDKGKSLGMHHMQREWWYFVPANAVVIFDEAGGEYDATKSRSRPEQLVEVFNRFGHAGWDLEFITQAYNNLDIQVRQKAHFVAEVHNSLNLSVFPGVQYLQSIRYPVKFFQVWCYEGLDYFKRGSQATVVDSYRVWPRKAYFRNYYSFSESAKVPWLRSLDDEKQESGDLVKDRKTRVQAALRQFWPLTKFGLWLSLGVYIFWHVVGFFLQGGHLMDGGTMATWFGATNAVAATNAAVAGTNGSAGLTVTNTGPVAVSNAALPVVKVALASTTAWRLTNGRWLKPGVGVGTNRVTELTPEAVRIGTNWFGIEDVEGVLNAK